MALAMTLENLDSITDASIKALYVKQDDGTFRLDVDGHHEKNEDPNRIPKSRLDAEIQKRKDADASLTEISASFVESVPEEMRDLIPDLPPSKKIKWIQQANAKGLFESKAKEPIDSKRPGSKTPASFEGLSPTSIMEQGYKK